MGATTALGAIWLLTAVNAWGVREAGILQLSTTVLKLLPLLAIGTLGILYLEPANFRPFNASGAPPLNAITATATLTLWAFLGLESATIPADSVRNPERIIPRATILGTVGAALIYVLATVGVMGILPGSELASSTAPFADAGRTAWGPWAGSFIAAGAAISAFGALNGWIMLQGQMPRAAAMNGLFPGAFRRLSRRGTPVFGLVVSSILATGLMALNYTATLVEQFTFIILLATLSTLVPYAFSALSQLVLFSRGRGRVSGERLKGPVAVAVLALLYSIWAIVGSGINIILWGLVLLAGGLPVYLWQTRSTGGRRNMAMARDAGRTRGEEAAPDRRHGKDT